MKASELRIGNLVMYSSAISMNEYKINECVEFPERFCPISLTEEWLFKLGFQGMDEYGLYSHPDNELFQVHHAFLDEHWDHIWDAAFTAAPIDHVHQLQNLYFALTGQELTIKP